MEKVYVITVTDCTDKNKKVTFTEEVHLNYNKAISSVTTITNDLVEDMRENGIEVKNVKCSYDKKLALKRVGIVGKEANLFVIRITQSKLVR